MWKFNWFMHWSSFTICW